MGATAFGTVRIRREDLPAGKVLCEYCVAKCCRYFALPIDTPESFEDYEFMRWYLLHDAATIFTEEDIWYLLVHTTCKHLLADNRCGIYDTRPQICREYSTDDCEYDDDWTYEHYWETPEQIAEYWEAIQPKKGQVVRSPRPPVLPIVA